MEAKDGRIPGQLHIQEGVYGRFRLDHRNRRAHFLEKPGRTHGSFRGHLNPPERSITMMLGWPAE